MHQYNLPLYFSILPYINPPTYALWIPCIFITPLFSFPSRHVLKHHHISNNHIPDHGSNKLSSKTLNPQEFQKHTTVFSQDHWSLAWTLKAYKTTPLIPIITAGNWFTLQSSQPWPNSLNSNTISYSQINFQKYSFIIKTNPNQAIRNDVLSTPNFLQSTHQLWQRTMNYLTPQKLNKLHFCMAYPKSLYLTTSLQPLKPWCTLFYVSPKSIIRYHRLHFLWALYTLPVPSPSALQPILSINDFSNQQLPNPSQTSCSLLYKHSHHTSGVATITCNSLNPSHLLILPSHTPLCLLPHGLCT